MIFRFRTAQQVKFNESRDFRQLGIPFGPDSFELGLFALDDAKAVHGYEQWFAPYPCFCLCLYRYLQGEKKLSGRGADGLKYRP